MAKKCEICGKGPMTGNHVSHAHNKMACRAHALIADLLPGGISKELVVRQARQTLEAVQAVAETVQRPGDAFELGGDAVERGGTEVADRRAAVHAEDHLHHAAVAAEHLGEVAAGAEEEQPQQEGQRDEDQHRDR